MQPLLTIGIAAGAALAVFVLLASVQTVFGLLARWWRRGRPTPLLADNLDERLEDIRPVESLADQFDRGFERMLARSPLGMSGAQGISALLLAAVAAGVASYTLLPSESIALIAGVGAALVLFVTMWLLHVYRQAQIQAILPDAIHLMARSLRAGLTVGQAVHLIGEQGQQPLASEFKRCADSMRLGMSASEALDLASKRIGLPDFKLLVSMVAMHRDTGGNLSMLVDRLAATIRSRNHFRGFVSSTTALSRLTGAVLSAAPVVLLVGYGLFYPSYLNRLLESSQGLSLLALALGLEVLGVLWMTWLLRIDY